MTLLGSVPGVHVGETQTVDDCVHCELWTVDVPLLRHRHRVDVLDHDAGETP